MTTIMSNILPWHEQLWQYLGSRKNLNSLPHALLITGLGGVGKFSFARNFAAFLLCQQKGQATTSCGVCDACLLLQAENHPDLIIVRPEEPGKAIKIDQVREIITDLSNTAHQGGMKVLIIEPAELLNIAAANALLKTLEEPTPNTLIILVSSHPRSLPATIRSRCQILTLNVPKYLVAEGWLRQQIPDMDVTLLLALAENAPLRALRLAQNDILLRRQNFFTGLSELLQGKIGVMPVVTECLNWDLEDFLPMLLYLVGDIIKIKFNTTHNLINQDQVASLTNFAAKGNMDKLFAFKDHLYELRRSLFKKINLNQQMIVENLIVMWTQSFGSIC